MQTRDLESIIDWNLVTDYSAAVMWTRIGIGDHFVSSGLIKHLSQKFQRVFLVTCPYNWPTVNYMFVNNPNVIVVAMDPLNADSVNQLVKDVNGELFVAMFDYIHRTDQPWFRACYEQYQLPYEARFELWNGPTHGPRSHQLYRKIAERKKPYMVIHHTCGERGPKPFDIDILAGRDPESIAHFNQIIVTGEYSNNLFDWSQILINAAEIHVVQSSIYHLCEMISDQLTGTVFYHNIRDATHNIPQRDITPYFPHWQIVEYPFKQLFDR